MINLKNEIVDELTANILPFWMNRMRDNERGGYHGRMTGENCLVPDEPKGVDPPCPHPMDLLFSGIAVAF